MTPEQIEAEETRDFLSFKREFIRRLEEISSPRALYIEQALQRAKSRFNTFPGR